MAPRGLAAHRRREAEAAASAAFDDAVGFVSGAGALGPAVGGGGGVNDGGGGGGCGGGGGVDPAPLAFLSRPFSAAKPVEPRLPTPLPPAGCTKRPRGAGGEEVRPLAAAGPAGALASLADMDLGPDGREPAGVPVGLASPLFPQPPPAVVAAPGAGVAAGTPPKRPRLSRRGDPSARASPPGATPPHTATPWAAAAPVSRARPPRHPALAPSAPPPPRGAAAAETVGDAVDVHGRAGSPRACRAARDDAAATLPPGARQELLDDVQYHLDGIFPPGGAVAALPLSTSRRVAGVLGLGRLVARRSRASPGADAFFATLRTGGLLREVVRRLLGVADVVEPPSKDLDAAVVLVVHLVARHPDNGPLFDAATVAQLLDVAGRWSPTDLSDSVAPPATAEVGAMPASRAVSSAGAAPRRTRRRRLRSSPSMALARPAAQRSLLREILVEDEAARAAAAEEHSCRQATLRSSPEPADVDAYVAAMLPPPRALPHVHPRVVSCVAANGWTVTYLALSTLALAFTHFPPARPPAGSTDALRLAWRVLAATSPALGAEGDELPGVGSGPVSSSSITSDATVGEGEEAAPAEADGRLSPPLRGGEDSATDGPSLGPLLLRCVTAEALRMLEYLSIEGDHAELLCQPRSASSGDAMRAALAAIAAGGRCHNRAALLTLEPLLAAALKVLINLSNHAAKRMERGGGVDRALTLLATEGVAVEEGARGAPAELLPFAAQETYDLRVLCLTLLTSIVTRCPAVGESFPSRQPPRLGAYELGGLGLLLQMVDANGRVGGCRGGPLVGVADVTPEQSLTSGYLSLLLGALAASGPLPCELIRQALPAPGGLGLVADALAEFLDFQVGCGIPTDGGMEARYEEIIGVLRGADAAAGGGGGVGVPVSSTVTGASSFSRQSL